MPSARTDAECIRDTATPATMAWVRLAPAPTRYAAVMVFPWPGPSAWTAPNADASTRDSTTIAGVNRHRMSPANDPPDATGAPDTVVPRAPPDVAALPGPGGQEQHPLGPDSRLASLST